MKKKEDIRSYTLEELGRLPDQTDWARVDAMTQEEVERLADEDDAELGINTRALSGVVYTGQGVEDLFRIMKMLAEKRKRKPISLKVEQDVLDHYKSQGPGYQTRMNLALRAQMLRDLAQTPKDQT